MAYAIAITDPAIAYLNGLQDLHSMSTALLNAKMKDRVFSFANRSEKVPYEPLVDHAIELIKNHERTRSQMSGTTLIDADSDARMIAYRISLLRYTDKSDCPEECLHDIVLKLFLQCCSCCTCNLAFKEAYLWNRAYS